MMRFCSLCVDDNQEEEALKDPEVKLKEVSSFPGPKMLLGEVPDPVLTAIIKATSDSLSFVPRTPNGLCDRPLPIAYLGTAFAVEIT